MSTLALEPVASVDAPLGFSNDIALVTNDITCLVDAYEFQIECRTRNGRIVGVFGRKGEGPGEFESPARIERAEGGAVALLDIRLDRITVFSVRGELLFEAPMPSNFSMSQLFPRPGVRNHASQERHRACVHTCRTGPPVRRGTLVPNRNCRCPERRMHR